MKRLPLAGDIRRSDPNFRSSTAPRHHGDVSDNVAQEQTPLSITINTVAVFLKPHSKLSNWITRFAQFLARQLIRLIKGDGTLQSACNRVDRREIWFGATLVLTDGEIGDQDYSSRIRHQQ